jgi:hypothetical protein
MTSHAIRDGEEAGVRIEEKRIFVPAPDLSDIRPSDSGDGHTFRL